MSVNECNPRVACRMRDDGHWAAVHASPSDTQMLKQILLDVEARMDPNGYGMYKEYRKEVFVRFRDRGKA